MIRHRPLEWVKHGFGWGRARLSPARLTAWAEAQYGDHAASPPLRGAVFTIEQLELHARALALTHRIGPHRGSGLLLRRLGDSERVIARCHELLARAHATGQRLTPAGEWLLDNHYVIEEQVHLARKHLPRGYSRQLPRLAGGMLAGLPRIYDLILEFIAHVDGRVDEEALARYLSAYQAISHLTLGELWSVAIMLRLALVENLRRVAVRMSWQRVHRDRALAWAQRIDAHADQRESAVLVLADMVREQQPLSMVFIAQFTQALQGRGATTTFVLAWLEQRLAEQGQVIEEVVRAESQAQAADQAAMANSIASLRFVNATEWHRFVEAHSATEAILRSEPAGAYALMDFTTRDAYRHRVEATARRLHLDEVAVARTAVALAARRHASQPDDVAAHVGYLLVDEGRPHLERALRGRDARVLLPHPLLRGIELFVYLGPVALLTAAGVAGLALLWSPAAGPAWFILALASFFAASQCAIAVVSWFATTLRRPRAMPRLDFEHGIPDACRTIVVVPTLLTGVERIAAITEHLERRYLANRDPNLWFGLLTDFCDAGTEHVEGDETLLAAAERGIEALNRRYGNGAHGHFFLFHRPREYNPHEGCWMGRERKRGKIEDFNALLRGEDRACFSRITGDVSRLTSVQYVITLDTDTDLPWGAGWRLVGAAAHPLNRPRMDPGGRRMVRGYAILQPRVGSSLHSAAQSTWARLLAGEVGLDPYTRMVSDLYQDLFAEASFVGKGIYDVGAFRHLLDGRFPDNAVLSHDLLESCYARTGQCSDVELLEDSPSGYLADVGRRHRWMRGDWQIAPWLGLWVHDGRGRRVAPSIAVLGWWKIFDNLRRALVAPAYAALLVVGWIVVAAPLPWTAGLLSLLVLPQLLPGLVHLWQRPPRLPVRLHLAAVGRTTLRSLARDVLWLVFVPFEAFVALDAAVSSLWRMFFSRHRLLEWQTAAAAERAAVPSLGRTLQRMWVGPILALAVTALLIGLDAPRAGASASPILLAWLLSPLVAWGVSRPLKSGSKRLGEGDRRFLRRVARLTWRYFEVFAGPQEHWLPPDNVQDRDGQRIAHRTSPTDMGMALLSTLSAYDLGYVSVGQLLDRTTRTLDSMEHLERHRGHFLNWYDTQTRQALLPLYVSTVDSGNLVGHVRVLRTGLLELRAQPVLPVSMLDGLRDTLDLLAQHSGPSDDLDLIAARLREQPWDAPGALAAKAAWLEDLALTTARIRASHEGTHPPGSEEAAWWAGALDQQVRALLADLLWLAPWIGAATEPITGDLGRLLSALDAARSLEEHGRLAAQAAAALDGTEVDGLARLADALRLGAQRCSARLGALDTLAHRCTGLASADFTFLYHPKRKLLAIGYWVASRRLDNSFYDLLASEARLASFVAIASGQLPFEHWFAMGRRLTTARGRQVLVSWSGSMFEYLMPLLVMPAFEGTLLDRTCQAAVARQIEYGGARGIPWGISESCYNITDVEGTYQYRAFGVPGLGLQRGLSDDVVIAPYASILALMVDPRRAVANLRRMESASYLGAFGFFEAVDFTPTRLPDGARAAVIRAFMAHHHGMSLLSLQHAVLGPLMQARFMRNPDFRAAALLLQERIPKASAIVHPHAWEARSPARIRGETGAPLMRLFTDPNTPIPKVHLLSNGRYHVMVTAGGGGYSRWNDLALTRWREDPTSDSLGVFCYVGDPATHRRWSGAFQPTLVAGQPYEAVFTPGRAEFRRHDDEVETHTEIAIGPEDDLEVRRITLTNRSETTRTLVVTSFAEVVLAPGVTDELHRAFSNLFVHAELAPGDNGLLVTRRSRSAGEHPPWMFCLLRASGHEAGPCSFETDRARFIGRGRSARRPAALDGWGPLPGLSEPALDPCLALRRTVTLAADQSTSMDLILGVAPTREAALDLISKYQDSRMADRVLESARPHSQAVLEQVGSSEADAQLYGQLASAVIFPLGAYRAPMSILRRNRKGQAGLWGYAISGDLPIVLLTVSDADHLPLVRDLLMAHAHWRMRGLRCDLVIWNEDASGYRHELNDQLLGLIAAGPEAALVDQPGGVFVRFIENFPEEDRVLLQAVARIVIRDVNGPLVQQLERWKLATPTPREPLSIPAVRAGGEEPLSSMRASAPTSPRDDLDFPNGLGGFTRDGREYIIDLLPGRHTPAPWVNVIANPRLGTVVSESGSACTWYGNAQLFRLTPWNNDPVGDPSGEIFLVRDEASGRFFGPMPWPPASDAAYGCRHGFGYSIFEHREDDLETVLTTFVAVTAPVKFWVLRIKNLGARSRRVSVLASVELVLGDLASRQAMHVVTEIEPLTGAIFARNRFNTEFPETVAFFDCSEAARSVSGDRTEILGRNGDPASPAAVRLQRLSGRVGPGLDPCAALLTQVELKVGAEREIVFVLGAGESAAEAIDLILRHRDVGAARVALAEVWRFWNDKLGVIHAETPDTAMNVMMNGWLPYQVLSSRMWGRSGFYQSGGAYGFRDQLQDCVALLHQAPDLARQQILRSAGRQFVEGDVQHWWHPPGGRGVRTRCSDDYLWLPWAVARYVTFTGDTGVLNERVAYLTGRPLNEGEESYYDLPGRSEQTGDLYEHCTRAILHGLRFGVHGLPLMGSGDWNDGMNRVGLQGQGESVWLGFFLHEVLTRFAPLARRRGDEAFAARCLESARVLAGKIEEHAWDGAWYRRAWFDDGQPLGTAQSAECRIDSLPQSWATISGVGAPERRRLALEALWEMLVREDLGIVQVLTPPFDQSALEPGYIKGYPPGIRENGGQYTHAAVWAAQALALAGQGARAAALVSLLNPIHHARDPAAVERYKVEPYVVTADIYSQPPHAGRGGWSWYTGSAAWYYWLLYEVILGIEREVATLRFHPRVPASWTSYRVHYRYHGTFYHLEFTQSGAHQGPLRLVLDGQPVPDGILALVDDQRDHVVEVVFAPEES
ncbi:MAG: glucoamylase family protein [Pseudomonadota bacterium]